MARILVVDDEPSFCTLLRICLAQAGHEVIEAHSGPEALAVLAGQRVDLVTLDVIMPGMSGLRTLELLRERHGPLLPVLIISGLSRMSDELQALKGGATYLKKPVAPDVLRAVVAQMLTVETP